jgi:hypothetical protein
MRSISKLNGFPSRLQGYRERADQKCKIFLFFLQTSNHDSGASFVMQNSYLFCYSKQHRIKQETVVLFAYSVFEKQG